jgi:CDP-glycerol glycerophosphotransferase
MINHFISPSQYATKCFISSFNLEKEQVIEVGYPRNDQVVKYKDDSGYIKKLKEELKIPLNVKVILYAPTYRDNVYCNKKNSHVLSNPLDSTDFLSCFGDGYLFLYRGHYFTSENERSNQFLDVSSYDNVNDILLVSDLLITDYSSLFFDYSILEKPSLFYMYDRKVYENKTRGFYLDIDKSLPGTISTLPSSLASDILHALSTPSDLKAFNSSYNPYENGFSSKRVIDAIIKQG